MRKEEEIKNNNFKEENKTINQAKKGNLTFEELTSAYEEVVDNFKTVHSVSRRMNKRLDILLDEKDTEIDTLKKELRKCNKSGLFTSVCLILAGAIIATMGLILM
jgi:hypothetical protein